MVYSVYHAAGLPPTKWHRMPNLRLHRKRQRSFWSQIREFSHVARDWLRKVRRSTRKALMVDEAAAALRRTQIMIAYGAV
jgi:hypothetical protein